MKSILAGRGYWGTILEKYLEAEGFENNGVYSRKSDISFRQMCRASDAAFICTPVSTHSEFIKEALDAGNHVFCEKMLTGDWGEAESLFRRADLMGKVLFTDYIYLFSPSILKMKEILPKLGNNIEIDMDISQQGKFYTDVDVFGNIGIHMLSVFGLMTDFKEPEIISVGRNASPATEGRLGIACGNTRGRLHASIVSEEKVRRIKISGEDGSASFDMMSPVPLRTSIGGSIEEYAFDEGNNLKGSLQAFKKAVSEGDYLQNRICSLYIEKLIHYIGRL